MNTPPPPNPRLEEGNSRGGWAGLGCKGQDRAQVTGKKWHPSASSVSSGNGRGGERGEGQQGSFHLLSRPPAPNFPGRPLEQEASVQTMGPLCGHPPQAAHNC